MIYGYARISTRKQLNGNSLEYQKEKLEEEGAEEIFADVYTGSKKDRPEFNKLMDKLQKGDKLLVCKLDRLCRSVQEGTSIIEKLFNRGVIVEIIGLGKIENTETGKLMFNVMMSFAQFEKNMILERMNEGREYARKHKEDYREGREPKYNKKQIKHALVLLEEHTYAEVTELTGISKSTLIRAKRAEKAKEIIQESKRCH